jgi:hypothetical protein
VIRRRVLVLVAVTATALVAASATSASHHPPQAVPGQVTLTVFADGNTLAFHYSVTPGDCTGLELCFPNYGMPNRLAIYVDGPGGTNGFRTAPQLEVGLPAQCATYVSPVVFCDTNKRGTDDPSAALPLTDTVTVSGKWKANSTAEIVVQGWTLDTYAEAVPVPAPDCSEELDAYQDFASLFEAAREQYHDLLTKHSLRDLAIAVTLGGRYLDGDLAPSVRWHDDDLVRLGQHLTHAKDLREAAVDAKAKYLDCLQGARGRASLRSVAMRPLECTDDEWGELLEQGGKLKLKKIKPLVRKILVEEEKKTKRKQTVLDIKRLKAQLTAEGRSIKAYLKKLDACS